MMKAADCGHPAPDDVEILVDGNGKEYCYCEGCQPVIAAAYGLKPKPKPEPKQFKPQLDTKEEKPVETKGRAVEPIPPLKSDASETDPYSEGRAAYVEGRKATDNPYDGRTKDGREWSRGFAEAEETGRG